MMNKFLMVFFIGIPFFVMDVNGWHMMGDWDHMMDWWGVPFMGFWWIGVWIVQFIIAFLVYMDAEKRENNGLLWFVLVILPWIGLIFLIVYLVIREEAFESKKTLTDAHKILDERYAKGEISREEYLQGKKDLSAKTEEDKET